MTQTPALHHLMGAYFHQDWSLDAADEWEVVDEFVTGEPQLARLIPAEVEWTLSHFTAESDVRRYVLRDLGSGYLADSSGRPFRDWLTQIADRVRRTTA